MIRCFWLQKLETCSPFPVSIKPHTTQKSPLQGLSQDTHSLNKSSKWGAKDNLDNDNAISSTHQNEPIESSLNSSKVKFPKRKSPHGETDFTEFVHWILDTFYKKYCSSCGSQVSSKDKLPSRPHKARCKCKSRKDVSLWVRTPLHHFKLPYWMFGFVIFEELTRYPQVISSSELSRRLGISRKASLLLKRRVQLFAKDRVEEIKVIMKKELEDTWQDVQIPMNDPDFSLKTLDNYDKIPSTDTMAMFSASQRANKGRSRYKHSGQTSSIFLSEKLVEEKGKYQIGTLVNSINIKGKGVVLESIPNQQQITIRPLLDEVISKDVPLMSDEGIPWYGHHNKNHFTVNHSKKSDYFPRYKYSRERWCTKQSVHNQATEGFFRNLKYSFVAGYSYISPEFSQMYLDEYSFAKGFLVYLREILALQDGTENNKGASDDSLETDMMLNSTYKLLPRQDSNLRQGG